MPLSTSSIEFKQVENCLLGEQSGFPHTLYVYRYFQSGDRER
ncbi:MULTISPECIES: hypothetical protein [Oscillatoriales]|nr:MULTISPECIES: hypothetical protein [Oscillatoriales]